MIGQSFGHFQILERIGAGGMGVVYCAHDTQLERTVAIKVIGDTFSTDASARARLLREARTASALNHAHICTIYEAGEANGQAYIAMEYLEGRPLTSVVPQEGLPPETVMRYGMQIAEALAHAHDRNVVHRDLKSANAIIGEDGRVKVLDFGLAKRLAPDDGEMTKAQQSLTEVGVVMGTLHYMAPEVLSGAPADARADLWALGVMLYEMATGTLPFQGRTPFEISSAILREPAPALPDRLPVGLSAVVQRLLAKDPAQRYQRANEVRAALEAAQSSVAVTTAVPASVAIVERPRWIWAAAVVVVALMGGVWALRTWRPSSPAGARLSNGGKASKVAEANEYFEKAMLFLKTQSDLTRSEPMLERALQLDPGFAEARAWYGFTHLLRFDLGFSNYTSWFFKAEEDLRRALQDDPASGRAHSVLAALYFYQGRLDRVLAEEEKALQANPDDFDVPIWVSNYHMFNGDYAAARAPLEKLMARDPLFLVPISNLADISRQEGDTQAAIRGVTKVLEQDPNTPIAIQVGAMAYQDAGALPDARQMLDRGSSFRQNYQVRLVWARQLALEGKRAEALRELDDEVLKYAGASPFWILCVPEVYSVAGEKAKALEWLERTVRIGDDRAAWFRRDPLLANIRNEPRFQQILDSIGLRHPKR